MHTSNILWVLERKRSEYNLIHNHSKSINISQLSLHCRLSLPILIILYYSLPLFYFPPDRLFSLYCSLSSSTSREHRRGHLNGDVTLPIPPAPSIPSSPPPPIHSLVFCLALLLSSSLFNSSTVIHWFFSHLSIGSATPQKTFQFTILSFFSYRNRLVWPSNFYRWDRTKEWENRDNQWEMHEDTRVPWIQSDGNSDRMITNADNITNESPMEFIVHLNLIVVDHILESSSEIKSCSHVNKRNNRLQNFHTSRSSSFSLKEIPRNGLTLSCTAAFILTIDDRLSSFPPSNTCWNIFLSALLKMIGRRWMYLKFSIIKSDETVISLVAQGQKIDGSFLQKSAAEDPPE